MASNPEILAAAAMTPQELEAAEFADAYYGAQAKLEAAKLLDQLGLDGEAAQMAMSGISAQLAEMDFAQKNETAEHLKQLGSLFGSTAIRQHVHLSAVPTEENGDKAAVDSVLGADVQEAKEFTTGESGQDKESAEPHELNTLEKRFIKNLFGERNLDIALSMSKEQYKHLLTILGEHYVNLKIIRLNKSAKENRRDIMMAYMYERESAQSIGERYGRTRDAIHQGHKKMINSILMRTDPEVLDDMIRQAAQVVAPDDMEISQPPERIVDSSIDTAQDELEEAQILLEPKSIKTITSEFADFLNLDDNETEFLHNLFDINRRLPDQSPAAQDVRELVGSLYKLVKQNQKATFTALETLVFDQLLLQSSPLTVRGVQNRLQNELKNSRAKIEEVLSSGIHKFLSERQRELRTGRSVLDS